MKKITSILLILALGLVLLASCSSAPTGQSPQAQAQTTDQSSRVPGRVPAFVREALMNVPDDVLVGIGVARLASESQSMTVSQTRARADISRQMNTMIQDMVRDYQASSEVDPSAAIGFQENITVALSRATLTGARVVAMDFTDDGSCWTVAWLSKNDVANEINQAQAAARLAVPAMASFDAQARMEEAFARQAAQPFQINEN